MSTKTISLTDEAYERLRAQHRGGEDSFSRVVMRASWEEAGITGGELLEKWRDEPRFFSDEELDAILESKALDQPPEDKWTGH